MYTLVLSALSGMMVSSVLSTEPAWMTDYDKARQRGMKEEKPLAVFIGSGTAGWEQVSREKTFAKQVKLVLTEKYVCLYVNREHEAGKKLASAFEVTEGAGLVISSRSGDLQAFRHEGDLTNQDLERYLLRYADPTRVTMHTETNPPSRVSYYLSAPQQIFTPVQYQLQYQPATIAPMSSFGSVGRSC
jgi:hypothetical protein